MNKGLLASRRRWTSLFGAPERGGFELVVNGERLCDAELAEFRRITGLRVIEPGRYWLDLATGNMGFEGEAYPRLNVFHQRFPPAANTEPAPVPAPLPLRRALAR